MSDIDPKEAGIHAGYAAGATRGKPYCPYPLYAEHPLKPKKRNPDREAWFVGYSLGRQLATRHHTELTALVVTGKFGNWKSGT